MGLKKELRKDIVVDSLICCLAGIILLLLTILRLFSPFDDLMYDTFMDLRAGGDVAASDSNIIIVAIDENSMTEIGQRWPWQRSIYAEVINSLSQSGAKAIGLDLLFIEPSTDKRQDEVLIRAMRQAGNVVIAGKLERLKQKFSDDQIATSGRRLVRPLQAFRQYAKMGIVNLKYSSGSIVRLFSPSYIYQEKRYPSFALALYKQAYGDEPSLGGKRHYIDYLGGPGTFPTVPIYSLLDGSVDRKMFMDKIVLVGATFSDAHDFFHTPLAASDHPSAGVEVQANILSTLINNKYIDLMPLTPRLITLVILVVIAGYLAMFRSAYWFWGAFIIIAFLSLLSCAWFFIEYDIFMEISYIIVALPLTFFMVTLRMRKPLVLNTKVGPYILHEELGRGGMAVVYRATHPRTKEEVALKQMLAEYVTSESSLKRFLLETELLRELDHPNIIRIVDAGDINGTPYYAMELIKGVSLDEVLYEKGRLSTTEVRMIGGAVARALVKAHDAGVIHRDLKPSNIMLTNTGIPKLTDFGIAKKIDAPNLTITGAIIGTPDFIPPELCKGELPSPLSDIYSFGATLYTLISGRPPFSGENFHTVINNVLNEMPIDINDLRRDIDDDLAQLIMQCLDKNPKNRPGNMLEIARRLDPFYTDIAMKTKIANPTVVIEPVEAGKTAIITKG